MRADEDAWNARTGQALERIDPILHHYNEALEQVGRHALFQKSLEELFAELRNRIPVSICGEIGDTVSSRSSDTPSASADGG